MIERYEIYQIEDRREAIETRGSKEKFWLRHSELGRCLFKFPRPDTGEDWSERIGARVAEALGLPCARYELAALRRGEQVYDGVLSVDFRAEGEELISGHSLLMEHTDQYPKPDRIPRFDSKIAEYKVPTVVAAIEKASLALPASFVAENRKIFSAADLFLGYLVLDALIGNQDRHHENWGAVEAKARAAAGKRVQRSLAPTFDHASSLGRLLNDAKREERLTTRDSGYSVGAYCARARSPFFSDDGAKQLTTHEAVTEAARTNGDAFTYWRERLEACRERDLVEWVEGVPEGRMSRPAKLFALEMLRVNRRMLLEG